MSFSVATTFRRVLCGRSSRTYVHLICEMANNPPHMEQGAWARKVQGFHGPRSDWLICGQGAGRGPIHPPRCGLPGSQLPGHQTPAFRTNPPGASHQDQRLRPQIASSSKTMVLLVSGPLFRKNNWKTVGF
jgi:hypothetical protein